MLLELREKFSNFLQRGDNRTKGWLFVDSPLPVAIFTFLYLFIVWIGPKLMANRKPFKLTWLLIPYNLLMSALNFYITMKVLRASTRIGYSYVCEPCQEISTPDELQIVISGWLYYLSKLVEFFDTFFFILRKKEKQLTFLHIYHHSTMLTFTWIAIKWVPSGSTFHGVLVNSAIHVLMYFYYGLSALGSHVSKYLWWKKYLTILQLIQFTYVILCNINSLRIGCDYPQWMQYLVIVYMFSFVVLFGNFYVKAYKQRRNKIFIDNSGINHTDCAGTLTSNDSSTSKIKTR